ncbi:hypothetical protein DJ56_3832 [Yersinia pestis]|nr:hypothetical protein DJ56_3832 [Yersinia pestis]
MTLCYTFWFLESISKRLVFYSYRKNMDHLLMRY